MGTTLAYCVKELEPDHHEVPTSYRGIWGADCFWLTYWACFLHAQSHWIGFCFFDFRQSPTGWISEALWVCGLGFLGCNLFPWCQSIDTYCTWWVAGLGPKKSCSLSIGTKLFVCNPSRPAKKMPCVPPGMASVISHLETLNVMRCSWTMVVITMMMTDDSDWMMLDAGCWFLPSAILSARLSDNQASKFKHSCKRVPTFRRCVLCFVVFCLMFDQLIDLILLFHFIYTYISIIFQTCELFADFVSTQIMVSTCFQHEGGKPVRVGARSALSQELVLPRDDDAGKILEAECWERKASSSQCEAFIKSLMWDHAMLTPPKK